MADPSEHSSRNEQYSSVHHEDVRKIAEAISGTVEDLRYMSRHVERQSMLAGYLTATNGLVLFIAVLSLKLRLDFGPGEVLNAVILTLSPLNFVCAVIVLNRFERAVAVGNAYYQELSDSLEWDKVDNKTRIETRISLKRFVISATLPFYRVGGNGPLLYVLINAVVTFSTVFALVFLTNFTRLYAY